jgi:hypothetical protein
MYPEDARRTIEGVCVGRRKRGRTTRRMRPMMRRTRMRRKTTLRLLFLDVFFFFHLEGSNALER